MKKFLYFAAFTLFATAMSFSLTACGGDDDDNNGNEVNNEVVPEENYGPLTPEGSAAVAVDLGLPSGTKWADRNVGADKPQDKGSYFAWGEKEPKTKYAWVNYKFGKDYGALTKYCNNANYGKDNYTDVTNPAIGRELKTLLLEDDAANVKWGGKWRMPTQTQIQELIANTDNAWVSNYNGTGVNGYKFSSKTDASKHIFLPADGSYENTATPYIDSRGYYWSSSLKTDVPSDAYCLYFGSGTPSVSIKVRCFGLPVRPVIKD